LFANKPTTNRLQFALLLKFFEIEGHFPDSKNEIPKSCAAFVAEQIDFPPELFEDFLKEEWGDIRRYRAQIRQFTGFREATKQDAKKMTTWLLRTILPLGNNLEQLKAAVYEQFKESQIEPPEKSSVDKLVRAAINMHDKQVFEKIQTIIPVGAIPWLDALVESSDEPEIGAKQLNITDIREEPGRANLKNMLREIEKLECLRDLRLPENLLQGFSSKLLAIYKQRVATEPLRELRRHPDQIKSIDCYLLSLANRRDH
jgi:hypothetical protein